MLLHRHFINAIIWMRQRDDRTWFVVLRKGTKKIYHRYLYMVYNSFLSRTVSEEFDWKRSFNEREMEKRGVRQSFSRADRIVGVLGSSEVNFPLEDGDPTMTEVLTSDCKYEQRTILYRDNITGVKMEALARKIYTLLSENGAMCRRVGQAPVTNESTGRNRDRDGAKSSTGVSSATVVDKNDQSNGTQNVGDKYDDMRNKCHGCFELRTPMVRLHRTRYPRRVEFTCSGSGEIITRLSFGTHGKRDPVGEFEKSKDG